METFYKELLRAPVGNLLVLAGIIFLAIAVVGQVSGKINPGKAGRIAGGIAGVVLLAIGLSMRQAAPEKPTEPSSEGPASPEPSHASTVPDEKKKPAGFRVIEVLLRADPLNYSGPCPVTIKFSGRISAIGGSGNVSYKFLRSDNASAPVQTLSFNSPASQDVADTWMLGGPGFSFSGWEAVQVLEPQEMKSSEARFNIRCQ
jgi:hypothetical protein